MPKLKPCFQANFGKVEELVVCANLGDHMIGNVYVKVYFPFLLL
jgi:hypothetical protein